MRPIDRQVILVTGATDGLGRALARELAARGATVLLHGRDAAKGDTAMGEIREATGNERLAFYLTDFSSLAQVRMLAEQILAEHDRLDVLVNNAGIGTGGRTGTEREVSEDGYELRFAVNYLAPYLLTQLLEPLLVRSAPARIVNVASAGQAAIDFDDVMLERDYSGVQAYCQSKTALVMLTFELADELRDRGVTANCLHPGTYMPTKMVLEAGVRPGRLARVGSRGDDASDRLPRAGRRDGRVLQPSARRPRRTDRPTTPMRVGGCANSAPSWWA